MGNSLRRCVRNDSYLPKTPSKSNNFSEAGLESNVHNGSLKFFIRLNNVKAYNLKQKSMNSSRFCTINWDNKYYERCTSKVSNIQNPKWPDCVQFYYSVDDLLELKDKYVVIKVWEDLNVRNRCIGKTCVDLMTVASGPISHELMLQDSDSGIFNRNSDLGHISFDLRMAQVCQLLISPVEVLVHIHEYMNELDQLEVEGVGTERSANPIAREAVKRTSSQKSLAVMDCKQNIDLNNTKYNEDIEDPIDHVLNDMATGGHTESDEIAPSWAQWQITFTPTGLNNPVEVHSSLTALCEQPYWNSVNHSIINATIVPKNDENKRDISTKFSKPLESSIVATNTNVLLGSDDGFEISLESKSLIPRPYELCPPLDASSNSKERKLRHTPLSSLNEYMDKKETLTSSLSRCMSTVYLDHINPQATYRQLAAICKQGRLIREMLHEDLPTLQLQTTSEFLRQNHLKVRLYGRRFSFDSLKFHGEAWIPFFKLYDVDIVEQMHQNFADAYFHEKLWYEGRCIGHLEGVVIFQNNPIVRQMLAGVNTDQGISHAAPLVLGSDMKLSTQTQNMIPQEVLKLIDLHQTLIRILYSKTQHKMSEVGVSVITKETKRQRFFRKIQVKSPKVMELVGIKGANAKNKEQSELHSVCEQILDILKTSHIANSLSFSYPSEQVLLIAQSCLLDFANHVLQYADVVPWQYRSTYGAILQLILCRKELNLEACMPKPPNEIEDLPQSSRRHLYLLLRQEGLVNKSSGYVSRFLATSPIPIGINKSNLFTVNKIETELYDTVHTYYNTDQLKKLIPTLSKDTINGIVLYNLRMKICEHYYLFLHEIFQYCLRKLSSDCIYEGQRKYISILLCICYFRVPEFHQDILKNILKPNERVMDIPEWDSVYFQLDEQSLNKYESWESYYGKSLNWNLFHLMLNEYFGNENLEKLIKHIVLSPTTWRIKFYDRDVSFFSFFEHWVKYIYQIMPLKKDISWHLIPGYPTLLKALLIELKVRDVTKCPDSLLNCTGAMLAHKLLLPVFIRIIFSKTCVYRTSAVFAALNYVDYWFQVLVLRNQLLPPNFDLRFLCRAIKIIFESNLCTTISKSLWFLYKNLPIFKNGQLHTLTIKLLLNQFFFMLFFNWSWVVRRCFFWLLLYRICDPARLILIRKPKNIDSKLHDMDLHEIANEILQLSCSDATSIPLAADDQTAIWSYLQLARYLSLFNLPPIFPKELTFKRLALLILKKHPRENKGSDSLKSTPPIPTNFQNQNMIFENFFEAIKWLANEAISQNGNFCNKDVVQEDQQVYLKHSISEFFYELQIYRNWVIEGNNQIPAMNIPAAPLDINVDVPLESA